LHWSQQRNNCLLSAFFLLDIGDVGDVLQIQKAVASDGTYVGNVMTSPFYIHRCVWMSTLRPRQVVADAQIALAHVSAVLRVPGQSHHDALFSKSAIDSTFTVISTDKDQVDVFGKPTISPIVFQWYLLVILTMPTPLPPPRSPSFSLRPLHTQGCRSKNSVRNALFRSRSL
jgi:hypothetical protein